MKKMKHTFLASAIALSALASTAVIPAANAAEVSASVSAANMYYWRGLDLGNGDPAIIGDVNISEAGFYTGLWASSGDAALGTEWDFYAGYGFDAGPVSVDLNYTTYMYPSLEEPIGFNDVSDVAVTLGFAASEDLSFKAMYRHGLSDLGDIDYSYATLSASLKSVTLLVGMHSDDEMEAGDASVDGLTHIDLSYAYNENLAFTLGKVIDDVDGAYNDEVKFVVTLSLPIGE